jgi:hypothetical protein
VWDVDSLRLGRLGVRPNRLAVLLGRASDCVRRLGGRLLVSGISADKRSLIRAAALVRWDEFRTETVVARPVQP